MLCSPAGQRRIPATSPTPGIGRMRTSTSRSEHAALPSQGGSPATRPLRGKTFEQGLPQAALGLWELVEGWSGLCHVQGQCLHRAALRGARSVRKCWLSLPHSQGEGTPCCLALLCRGRPSSLRANPAPPCLLVCLQRPEVESADPDRWDSDHLPGEA